MLQNPDGFPSLAVAINDAGQAVGNSEDDAPALFPAVLWSRSGKPTILSGSFAAATAINASGWTVGHACTTSDCTDMEAVLWSPSGKETVLGSGGLGTEAVAINASGQSIGLLSGQDSVLWSPSGKATLLQGLSSHALALNDAGRSVGWSEAVNGDTEPVLWSPSGKATALQDSGQGEAVAINDAGWSVGYSWTGVVPFSPEAILWSPSGKATNLDAILGPAWTDALAQGINNSGDIVGSGEYHGEPYRFLLTPVSAPPVVPEPSTWVMMLAGFAGLGFAGLGFAGYRRAKTGRATLAGLGRQPPPTRPAPIGTGAGAAKRGNRKRPPVECVNAVEPGLGRSWRIPFLLSVRYRRTAGCLVRFLFPIFKICAISALGSPKGRERGRKRGGHGLRDSSCDAGEAQPLL